MDTVHRTGVDGFLENGLGIAVLVKYPRAPIVRFDVECVRGHVGAVLATDTGRLVHIDAPLSQSAPQFRLETGAVFSLRQKTA
jgi:hypothetical protein